MLPVEGFQKFAGIHSPDRPGPKRNWLVREITIGMYKFKWLLKDMKEFRIITFCPTGLRYEIDYKKRTTRSLAKSNEELEK